MELTNLKTDLFRFGVYRLAGGLDNNHDDSQTPIIDVRTNSFSIQMMKYSAANMLKNPIEFVSESSILQNSFDERGNLTI
jgi:hypothetical protein